MKSLMSQKVKISPGKFWIPRTETLTLQLNARIIQNYKIKIIGKIGGKIGKKNVKEEERRKIKMEKQKKERKKENIFYSH